MSLTIEKSTARRLFDESPKELQELFIQEFGEQAFVKEDFENIKIFDDACKACATTEKEFDAKFSALGLSTDTISYEKLKIITKAINKNWIPDWNNRNENKWWPWFRLSSGFGFAFSDYGSTNADTDAGSRLCFQSKEKSDYAGQQFIEIYKAFIL